MEKINITKEVYVSSDGKIFENEENCIDWECAIERINTIKTLHFNKTNTIRPNYRAVFKSNDDVSKIIDIITSDTSYDIAESKLSKGFSIREIKSILHEYLYIYKYSSKDYHNIHACDENTVFEGEGIYLIEYDFDFKKYNLKSPEPICISFMKLSEFIRKCDNSLY